MPNNKRTTLLFTLILTLTALAAGLIMAVVPVQAAGGGPGGGRPGGGSSGEDQPTRAPTLIPTTAPTKSAIIGNVSASLPVFCQSSEPTLLVYTSQNVPGDYFVQIRATHPASAESDMQPVTAPSGLVVVHPPGSGGTNYPDYALFTYEINLIDFDEAGNYRLVDTKNIDVNCSTREVTESLTIEEIIARYPGDETVFPITPIEAAPYKAILFEDQAACGVFEVNYWGIKKVILSTFPDCEQFTPDQIQIACFTESASWSNTEVRDVQVSDNMVQATISQHGYCGVFPSN